MKSVLTLSFTERELEHLIDTFHDAKLALCDLDCVPRQDSIGDYTWRDCMEKSLLETLHKVKFVKNRGDENV